MLRILANLIQNKRIVLLGFGLEGQSSFRFFTKYFPKNRILVADRNPQIANHPLLQNKLVEMSSGEAYLGSILEDDFIVKSPGIKLPSDCRIETGSIYSQTDLFIQNFRNQIIGITGTKGKSTTSSLLFKILQDQGKEVVLLGNIGKPAFDYWDKITDHTFVVFELSAHQLEYTKFSPAYAILLNLFPEHLDYFRTENHYFDAKFNIAKFQLAKDRFYFGDLEHTNFLSSNLKSKLKPSVYELINDTIVKQHSATPLLQLNELLYLKGLHQLKNCLPLLSLSRDLNLDEEQVLNSIKTFVPLPHRIEFAGKIKQTSFYNDSISTIPEASIEALKALQNVRYLILGGLDRTLDYQKLYSFLLSFPLKKVFFIGPAGKRMFAEMNLTYSFEKILLDSLHDFEAQLPYLIQDREPEICLLSPAAASYDEFRNFEARGDYFKSLIHKLL